MVADASLSASSQVLIPARIPQLRGEESIRTNLPKQVIPVGVFAGDLSLLVAQRLGRLDGVVPGQRLMRPNQCRLQLLGILNLPGGNLLRQFIKSVVSFWAISGIATVKSSDVAAAKLTRLIRKRTFCSIVIDDGQCKHKRAAFCRVGFNEDITTVTFGDPFTDGQSDASSLVI